MPNHVRSRFGQSLLPSRQRKYVFPRAVKPHTSEPHTAQTERSAFAGGAAEQMVEVADGLLTALRDGTYVPEQETKPGEGSQTGLFSKVEFGGASWYVLDKKDGKTLLLSEKIIDKRTYSDAPGAVTWETSALRGYLNGEYLNGFSAADREKICEVTNANRPNGKYAVSGGADTLDRVFLLSRRRSISADSPTSSSRRPRTAARRSGGSSARPARRRMSPPASPRAGSSTTTAWRIPSRPPSAAFVRQCGSSSDNDAFFLSFIKHSRVRQQAHTAV